MMSLIFVALLGLTLSLGGLTITEVVEFLKGWVFYASLVHAALPPVEAVDGRVAALFGDFPKVTALYQNNLRRYYKLGVALIGQVGALNVRHLVVQAYPSVRALGNGNPPPSAT